MKALVKAAAEPGLWMQDVPEPEPGPRDVKIRVHKTSICGTDLHIRRWDAWAQATIPVPIEPDAPTLLSITMGCPRLFWR